MRKIWKVVRAAPEHVPVIAANMREADRREVWASDGLLPETALLGSLNASAQAWTCLVEGRPAFMWGAARKGSILSGCGVPWLLGTDDIYKVSREFSRQSRAYVARMHAHFPRLENLVHAENRLSIRWLAWCGFIIEERPILINRENFFHFWRETECVR